MAYPNYYPWLMNQYSMANQYAMPSQYYMPSFYYGYGQQLGYGYLYPSYGGSSYGFTPQPTSFYQYQNPMGYNPFGFFEQAINPYYSMTQMGFPMGYANPYRQLSMLPSY
jgi:hypothetical protein